ncbi:spore maturation protein A [Clostridium acidisoli DSM 12555]|uniref:Spore maturation protein A n=1 Tax=Clostridium acidisoli DSM 12555 TaxID=1121291 RepID=A0A1W1XT38_9CLOT|nr:nucleoside recognition domain-containing protein [Clostridium acidisoli]SMC27129.1 spore maturation protein A [Clostridium acidisoli DSM 12555]
MINYVWFFILIVGIVFGIITGRGEIVSKSIIDSTAATVELTIQLIGLMCLWCGVMRIAEKSGITNMLSKILRPLLKIIFRKSSNNPEIVAPMIMNLTSNIMGLSNAATPFGIKTMEAMEKVNTNKGVATNDMARFLVLNAACIQLVPTSVISIRAASGSQNPGIIIIPAIITTAVAAIMGMIYCSILERYF